MTEKYFPFVLAWPPVHQSYTAVVSFPLSLSSSILRSEAMHSAELGCSGISSRPKMCFVLDFPATLLTDSGKASLIDFATVLKDQWHYLETVPRAQSV